MFSALAPRQEKQQENKNQKRKRRWRPGLVSRDIRGGKCEAQVRKRGRARRDVGAFLNSAARSPRHSLSLSLALFSEEEEEEEILRKGFPVVVVVVVVVVHFFFLFLLARLPAFHVFLTFDLTLSFFFCSSPSLSFSLSLSLCYPNQMLC